MQVDKININDIIPADYNPRQITPKQLEQLEQNMQRFGLVDPIIINNKNNHIIGGHQRYTILKQKYKDKQLQLIKLGDIGWVFDETNLKLEDTYDEKALNIALNNLSGEFNDENLGKLLNELQQVDYDLNITGFEDYEVYDLTVNYTYDNLLNDSQNNTWSKSDIKDEFEEKNEYHLSNENNTRFTNDTNETSSFKDVAPNLNKLDGSLNQSKSFNIHFNNQNERNIFMDFITNLKNNNPEKTITHLIIEYMQDKLKLNKNSNTQDYICLCESEQEYDLLVKLHTQLQEKYSTNPLLTLILDDDI